MSETTLPVLHEPGNALIDAATRGTHLEMLEVRIEESIRTHYMEVGSALEEIRETKLYRAAGYETFDAYCRDRWQFSASRARQMIAASRVAIESVTTGNTPPATEREAREIIRERNEAAKPEPEREPEPESEEIEDVEVPDSDVEIIEPSDVPRLKTLPLLTSQVNVTPRMEVLQEATSQVDSAATAVERACNELGRSTFGRDELHDQIVTIKVARDALTASARTLESLRRSRFGSRSERYSG